MKHSILFAFAAGALIVSAQDQPYIYDYYNSGMTPEEYVAQYKGEAYKGPHTLTAAKELRLQAEDFDNGGTGIAYNFNNKKSNNYRPDMTEVAINGGGSGYVIGNVTAGDWLCYTLEVEDAGEYSMTIRCSSDNPREFYYELDGMSIGEIMMAPGKGWDTYSNVVNAGLQLSAGRHVLRWIPSNSMNVDYYIFKRTGEFTGRPDVSAAFEYPRYSSYTTNPMFTDLTSPMWQCGFISPLYTADPSAHVWNIDGREVLYLYPSCDLVPTNGCDHMDRYHIFSTEDMVNWTDHGETMNSATTNHYTGFTQDGWMWAPDCNYNKRDGLYYYVYPHKTVEREWLHFVATSPCPHGPFTVRGFIEGIPSTIDPCLFVDDDGSAYIYTSGAGKGCWGAKLKDNNWLELDGEMKPLEGGFESFHEGPFMFKKDGVYYLTYADGNPICNQLRYSTAKSPLGPFTYGGVYMYPHGHDTAHGSIVEFKGKYYQFYHTGDFSKHGNQRSVCFDELTFSPDGKINPVNVWGEPYSGTPVTISKAAPAVFAAGEYNVGWNAHGWYKRDGSTPARDGRIALSEDEWLRYSIKVTDPSRYAVTIRAKQNTANSKIRVACTGQLRTAEGGVTLPAASNTKDVQELYIYPVSFEAGEVYFELRVKAGEMEIESFTIAEGQIDIPGVIQAEDLDADDYKFQDRNAALNQHSYRDDVWVAISSGSGAWHIGNVSSGDYYNYTFNCKTPGTYQITTTLAVSATNSAYRLSIDGQKVSEESISGTDWGKWFTKSVSNVHIDGGVHKLRFDVVRGPLNVDKFDFRCTKADPVGIVDATYTVPEKVDVYDLHGRLIRANVDHAEAVNALAPGLYIVGREKVLKK